MSEPDCGAASTTSTPRARPEITRLRCGKFALSGGVPGANCVTMQPFAAIACASSRWLAGYTRSGPVPMTAIVDAAVSSAPRWAAASMPCARPDTTVRPASPSARPNARASSRPCGVAWRLPTIAIEGRASRSTRPIANRTGGGSPISSSWGG